MYKLGSVDIFWFIVNIVVLSACCSSVILHIGEWRLSAQAGLPSVKICACACEEVLCLLSGPQGADSCFVFARPHCICSATPGPRRQSLACVCECLRLSGATGLTQ